MAYLFKLCISIILIIIFSSFTKVSAQNVYIADPNLYLALWSYDTDLDGNISVIEAYNCNSNLDISYSNVTSLVGLEYFVNIKSLNCSGNQLTDISQVNSCVNIETLNCSYNNIYTILNVSSLSKLTMLLCNDNQISQINFGGPKDSLGYIDCSHNQLTSLGFNPCLNLNFINCSFNQISSMNLQSAPNLYTLYCYNNQMNAIDVSGLVNLSTLLCNNNQLYLLDLTSNWSLGSGIMDCQNNPNLYCITVQNVSNTSNFVWYKDVCAQYNTTCNFQIMPIVNIPDTNFKNKLIQLGIDCNNDGEIQEIEAFNYQGYLDVSNENISNLTGINYFENITALNCSYNNLSNLFLTNLPNVGLINCSYNNLSNLSIINSSSSSFPMLGVLYCENNQLTSLTLNDFTSLAFVDCSYNQLDTLFSNNNISLWYLNCSHNNINTNIGFMNNIALTSLYCSFNQLTSLNLIPIPTLTDLDCSNNQLSNLDLNLLPSLNYLYCTNNQLTNLNLSNNTALVELYCDSNQISCLNLNNNTLLEFLNCSSNQLSNLNIAFNNSLVYFDCTFNSNLSCIGVVDTTIANSQVDWYKDPLATYNTNCVSSSPTVTITTIPSNASICIGESIILSASGATNYSWTGGVTNSVAFSPTISATYTVTGTDACGYITTATIAITVNSCGTCLPDITISTTPFTTALTESQTWIKTSGTVLIPVGANVKFDANASSYVQLNPGFRAEYGSKFLAQAFNGCTAGSPQKTNPSDTTNSNNLNNAFVQKNLILYPNPTSGKITLMHPKEVKEIQVFDMVGKRLLLVKTNGNEMTELDISEFPNGIYHVRTEGFTTIKVIKH